MRMGLLAEYGRDIHLGNVALREEYRARGVLLDKRQVVCGHNHRAAALGYALEDLHNTLSRHGVEVARGFVGEQKARVIGKRAGDG